MSQTNHSHITRQWHIIQYLLDKDVYVSSEDVFAHLQDSQVEVKDIRTVQRDLNTLAAIFPIECRKDDKPYGWRWQRSKDAKKNHITQEQAIVLTLVDSKLRDILSDDLLSRLQPLFIKAKMQLAGIDYQHSDLCSKQSAKQRHPDKFATPTMPTQDGRSGNKGFTPHSITLDKRKNLRRQLAKLFLLKTNKASIDPWQWQVKQEDVEELVQQLRKKRFDKLADKIKGVEKFSG